MKNLGVKIVEGSREGVGNCTKKSRGAFHSGKCALGGTETMYKTIVQ